MMGNCQFCGKPKQSSLDRACRECKRTIACTACGGAAEAFGCPCDQCHGTGRRSVQDEFSKSAKQTMNDEIERETIMTNATFEDLMPIEDAMKLCDDHEKRTYNNDVAKIVEFINDAAIHGMSEVSAILESTKSYAELIVSELNERGYECELEDLNGPPFDLKVSWRHKS